MKFTLLLIVSTLFISEVFCQNSNQDALHNASADISSINTLATDTDSVNISQMVLAQINTAREKEKQSQNVSNSQIQFIPSKAAVQDSPGFLEEVKKQFSISDDTMLKISILLSASFLAMLVIFMRRRKLRLSQPVDSNLKDNIKLLREEKIKIQGNSKLSSVRNRLTESTPAYNLSQDVISNSARKLNISKEEILLAQKLKRMR